MLESRRCKAPEDSCFESMAENAVYALMRRHIAQRDGIGDRFVGTGSPVNFQSDNTVGRSWQSRRERTSACIEGWKAASRPMQRPILAHCSRPSPSINQARKYPPGIYGPPPTPVPARLELTRLVAAPAHPHPGLTRPMFIGRVNKPARPIPPMNRPRFRPRLSRDTANPWLPARPGHPPP
jgi:hypothetical protein